MAKHNMLLGQARGKVGDLVFSRAFGKQIVRAKAASVANPKTVGQNTQRAILASVAKAAAALTPIVDHSFAGVTYGAESVRHFRKINMAELRKLYLSGQQHVINLTPKGGGFLPNPFVISGGQLPSFGTSQSNSENVGFYQDNDKVLELGDNGVLVSSFKEAYPYIQNGDQLTLVRINKVSGNIADGDALFMAQFDRVVLSPSALDDDAAFIFNDEGAFNQELLDMTKTTNASILRVVTAGSGSLMGVQHQANGDNPYAVALILSRKVNNTWQRSTQSLYLAEWDDFMNNESAIESYGATESLASATEYLNQADGGSEVAGQSGPYMQTIQVFNDNTSTQEISVGGTLNLERMTIVTGKECKITASAYGTEDNPLVALDIEGTSTDGEIEIIGTVRNNAGSVTLNVGEDGNLAGTYKVTAVYRNGRAVANVTIATSA